jgi:hypothetical protein
MKEKIQEALKTALKAGDKLRVSVLRMLIADIQNAELAGQEALDGIVGYGRRLEKSIEEYRRLGKHDEAARIAAEHKIVSEFLPAKPTEADVQATIDRIAAQENLVSMKDFGRGMKLVLAALGPQADGRKVQELLKKKLAG